MSTEQDTQINWFGRKKPRPMEDLLRDNGFTFQVGRLVGAVTMAAHLLSSRDEAEVKEIGTKLNEVLDWFYTDEAAALAQRKPRP